MIATIERLRPVTEAPTPDLRLLKARQHMAWSSGDYAVIGTTLQIVGERLAESMDLRAGQTVLDVAAGNGNMTLAAARRCCEVTCTDYVEALLASARRRAEADGLHVQFEMADAENLPFADASFDAVVSTFGAIFCLDQHRAAAELMRVTRRGGRIGLANWTPEGFIGQLFKTIGKTSRRRSASGPLPFGAYGVGSVRRSTVRHLRSWWNHVISPSAIARRGTSLACTGNITDRCSKRSKRSMRPTGTRWRKTSSIWSGASTNPATI